MKYESLNKLFTNTILKISCSTFLRNSLTTTLRFVNKNMSIEAGSTGSKSSYWPISYIWIPFSNLLTFFIRCLLIYVLGVYANVLKTTQLALISGLIFVCIWLLRIIVYGIILTRKITTLTVLILSVFHNDVVSFSRTDHLCHFLCLQHAAVFVCKLVSVLLYCCAYLISRVCIHFFFS
jgi:hypothetical protein